MTTLAPKSDFTPDEVVVKTASRTWMHQVGSASSSTLQTATARKLLDGAIVAAKSSVSSLSKPPALTRTRWVWRLAGAYHLCHSTERLMEEAARRFSLAERWSLAQWAARKATEETSHDRLALLDIQAMGYQADAVVKALVPPAARTLVDYFTQSVQASDPIGCVGYSYAMERLATAIGEEYINRVELLLPSGIYATRCLRVHSGVGADREHVEETVALVAGLTSQERGRVAKSCYQTALLCFSAPQEGYISDEELHNRLQSLESSASVGES